MSAPLPDASSASSRTNCCKALTMIPVAKAIAEHFAKQCLCHQETTHPQCPAVKARRRASISRIAPKAAACSVAHFIGAATPARAINHRYAFPPPSHAPDKPSPHLRRPDAPPPAKYPPCSVHPAPEAASRLRRLAHPAPQHPQICGQPQRKKPASLNLAQPIPFFLVSFSQKIHR